MKNKGFTLLEMIVTIALLSFVGVVVSMNMIKVLNNQNEKKEADFKALLKDAGCAYAGLSTFNRCNGNNTTCKIPGKELVEQGMIDEVINGFESKNYNVFVVIEDGLKNCYVQEG